MRTPRTIQRSRVPRRGGVLEQPVGAAHACMGTFRAVCALGLPGCSVMQACTAERERGECVGVGMAPFHEVRTFGRQ